MNIGGIPVGHGQPAFIIAEIGINHNGDVDLAKSLIDVAADAGCQAVKFQKREPEISVPAEQRTQMRETPWGQMSYLEYRNAIEFDAQDYAAIDDHCKDRGILWFASPWDVPSLEILEEFEPPAYKIASACLTDYELVERTCATGKPVILSTGMSQLEEIDAAVNFLRPGSAAILHCTSTYPCPPEELNLRVMQTLRDRYGFPVGYSGHETGLATTVAAVAMGACIIERHVTLDRALWGSDQAASIEPPGLRRLVRDIRLVESAKGDGRKRVYESELLSKHRLRRKNT